ncbi:hypothetical protein CHS0354_034729 [Potamilus streckersoni]|uniref:Uncharacterized protein n=1 Tax=Potamilus streckersoni TaxID=2493646 RepID=A0AAE0VWF6_9BIVA|nr:hypothetical protein CHS0354_034729 [Potamilus streckersoni]
MGSSHNGTSRIAGTIRPITPIETDLKMFKSIQAMKLLSALWAHLEDNQIKCKQLSHFFCGRQSITLVD